MTLVTGLRRLPTLRFGRARVSRDAATAIFDACEVARIERAMAFENAGRYPGSPVADRDWVLLLGSSN